MTAFLSACSDSAVELAPEPSDELPSLPDSSSVFVEEELRQAFLLGEPFQREREILRITGIFLRDSDMAQQTDEEISAWYTEIADSSSTLSFPEPAIIRRYETLSVVAIPDVLGLYLHNEVTSPQASLEPISRWAGRVNDLSLIPAGDRVGVVYQTTGPDGLSTAHYALLMREQDRWRAVWRGDEALDWWFNPYDARIEVSDDLAELIVVGQALSSTSVFNEATGQDGAMTRRTFAVRWIQDEDGYRLSPPPTGYRIRQEWLWQTAVPSPYATLVEFTERLQLGQRKELENLVSDQSVIDDAVAFGLHLAGRRYTITEISGTRISFRDQRGAFVVDIKESEVGWQLSAVVPLGAAEPLNPQ